MDLIAYRKRKREYARTPLQREKRRLYMQYWRDKNREKHNAYSRERYRKNPELVKSQNRKARLRGLYGLTLEQYDEMVHAQEGACYLCKRSPTANRLAIDHDHATGKIRKLLCSSCNKVIGVVERLGLDTIGAYIALGRE